MRIVSGKYKGRIIEGFDMEGTRPTMDRVKESLFGSIQNYINGTVILDLFSGSGNLGIEALSNGSSEAYLVDISKEAINIINKNIKEIRVEERVEIIKEDYKKVLDLFEERKLKFDIVFLDPPYNMIVMDDIINLLVEKNLLNNDALVICEYEKDIPNTDKLKLFKEKKYGSKYIRIYKKNK